MAKPKWEFLEEWAKKTLANNKGLTTTDLARRAIGAFKLSSSEHTVRMALTNLLKRSQKEVPQSVVNYLQVVSDINKVRSRGNRPTFYTYEEVSDFPDVVQEKAKQVKSKFTTPGDYIVLGCMHVPGHDASLVKGITQMMKENKDKIQGLMLIGDFLDMNSLSGHDINKFTALPGLTLSSEYAAGNRVLDMLTDHLKPSADRVYLYGNHEDRWNRYMADMQKAKTPLQSPAEALNLESRGFNVFTHWEQDFITLGKHLDLMHGQYFNVHSAKKHIDTYRGSIMYAHTHRIQTYIEGSTGGFNIGWGGDISSPLFNYMPRGTKKQWMNGFAVVTIDNNGEYYVTQVYHHSGKFRYNGKFY